MGSGTADQNKDVLEVARDLRSYAIAGTQPDLTTKLLAAALELEDIAARRHDANAG